MRMIPNRPCDTGSQAEKRIFERLRAAFDDRYAAFHSLMPTRHPRKHFPEIDFVVCGPEGLYTIEVKGGRVACRDGVWRYRDRNGGVSLSQESPFRQAETALHGLMQDLRANLPEDVLDRLTTGYGVVFPDCEWRAAGAEWDPAMLADVRRSRDLEGWLRGLFGYWRARGGRKGRPDEGALSRLQGYLRPEVDAPEADAPEAEDASRLPRPAVDDHERRLPEPCAESRVRSLRPEPDAPPREEAPRLHHQVEDTRRRGAGPAVRRQDAATRQESAERIAGEIVELVDVGGLAPGSVTILSPLDLAGASVALMPPDAARRVRRLDEYSMRDAPGDKVGFARIGEFKGLENEAIVVVDLPAPDGAGRTSAEHYVAMSRARSVLSLIHRGPA